MAQADYIIANQAGNLFRADLNDTLSAIVSNNSSATEPATMYAYQWWADTNSGLLKQRNAANNGWVTIGTMAQTNLGLLSLSGGAMTGAITTNSTFDGRDVAVDGGALDTAVSKLSGIEAGATTDQTDAQIRAAVEAATDSNVFTDADHTKLNETINTKIINIGAWDMRNGASSLTVAHGLTFSKIRQVDCMIYQDNGNHITNFLANYGASTGASATGASVINVYLTDVILSRQTGGYFYSSLWNSTSINRGYITIQYVD